MGIVIVSEQVYFALKALWRNAHGVRGRLTIQPKPAGEFNRRGFM
jgi:hypothetical protein